MDTTETCRNNLQLGDKVRILHLYQVHKNQSKLARIWKVYRKKVKSIHDKHLSILACEANGTPLTVKRPLYAKHPAVEADVINFIKYVRSKRLSVTSTHNKERALCAASKLKISNFSASNGWLEKFSRESAIQRSFKLHGQGSLDLAVNASAGMQDIRDTSSEYHIRNIYNMDESGLFYRMGPRMTYLTRDEDRSTTRGMEVQKHKSRVSIVMCVNADGSHVLPVSYTGTASKPKCFKDARFIRMKQNYWTQSNGWMGSKGFLHWINTWYKEVKKLSS